VPVAAITALIPQCWALSALLLYWLLFGWLYKRLVVHARSLRGTLAWLTGIWCIPAFILTMLVVFDKVLTVRSSPSPPFHPCQLPTNLISW